MGPSNQFRGANGVPESRRARAYLLGRQPRRPGEPGWHRATDGFYSSAGSRPSLEQTFFLARGSYAIRQPEAQRAHAGVRAPMQHPGVCFMNTAFQVDTPGLNLLSCIQVRRWWWKCPEAWSLGLGCARRSVSGLPPGNFYLLASPSVRTAWNSVLKRLPTGQVMKACACHPARHGGPAREAVRPERYSVKYPLYADSK